MFGGLGFLLNGNLLVGVWKQSMIVRLGPNETEAALLEPHVGKFDITGKPMKGWVMIAADGVADEGAVKQWVMRASNSSGSFLRNRGPLAPNSMKADRIRFQN